MSEVDQTANPPKRRHGQRKKGMGLAWFLAFSIPCILSLYLLTPILLITAGGQLISLLEIIGTTEKEGEAFLALLKGLPDALGTLIAARLLILCMIYIVWLIACVLRGIQLRRNFLWAFVAMALVLDVFFFFPLIPTLFIILALVFGCVEQEQSVYT